MTIWGAIYCKCAFPDCPNEDKTFLTFHRGCAHLYVVHGIRQGEKAMREALIQVGGIPRRTWDVAFKEWKGMTVKVWGTSSPEAKAFKAGWKARVPRRRSR